MFRKQTPVALTLHWIFSEISKSGSFYAYENVPVPRVTESWEQAIRPRIIRKEAVTFPLAPSQDTSSSLFDTIMVHWLRGLTFPLYRLNLGQPRGSHT